jgi:hypothetical protein
MWGHCMKILIFYARYFRTPQTSFPTNNDDSNSLYRLPKDPWTENRERHLRHMANACTLFDALDQVHNGQYWNSSWPWRTRIWVSKICGECHVNPWQIENKNVCDCWRGLHLDKSPADIEEYQEHSDCLCLLEKPCAINLPSSKQSANLN